MDARERRRAIMAVLEGAKGPVSGSALAREVGVSRQIVVQDIALLRADGHDIVATNRGYVLQEAPSSPAVPTRLVKVRHSVEQAGDELTSIVDAGGAVLNVIVNHRVYGKITADLDIRNRRDVERYLRECLDSALAQTLKDIEIICINDGSTDNSPAIIREYM